MSMFLFDTAKASIVPFMAAFGGVVGVLIYTLMITFCLVVLCLLFRKKMNFLPNTLPPSSAILPPPTALQPEHPGSSFAYTPLSNSDKVPPAYDLRNNLATHNTQRMNERSNLPQSHQASYGACAPTTSHPTAPVAPPLATPPYFSSATAPVAPPPPFHSSAAAPVAPPPYSSGGYTTGTSAVSAL